MKIASLILLSLSAAIASAAEPTVLVPPMPPSPIAEFRQWLSMPPTSQKLALAKRSERSRKVLEQKLEEYSALPKPERERRLDALELRWYLRPLMETAPGAPKRAELLDQVPIIWHPMVQVRLLEWDKLTPALRKEALEHDLALEYFSSPPQAQQVVLRSLKPEDRQRLEARAERLQRLPDAERAKLDNRLGQFFSMNQQRQARALNSFREDERAEMEKTLQAVRDLSPEKRQECIDAFSKLAGMDRIERISFLKNVERWQAMAPDERDQWRKIVKELPPHPPLPPGLDPSLPPIPAQ